MKHPKGFTILELIIYIGISVVVLSSLLRFGWRFISDQTKQFVVAEVLGNGRHVVDTLTYHTQRARDIEETTIYGAHPGTLVLDFSDDPDLTFDTYTKQVNLGEQTVTIRKLRMTQEGFSSVDMTSDNVDVTNFLLTDLTPPASDFHTVEIDMTLEYINPANSSEYAYERSWNTAITVRAR